ncbi:hypothetical protein ACH5Y9_07970 [Methylomonas sp. BW4-1]|uniref:hypothetical protein n=1 Tax=unclassified Methylomonas TaxID=2608980 RepID=UPI00037E4721|nr:MULTISPECIES: hypothetical protein [unclassified Methylomonas]
MTKFKNCYKKQEPMWQCRLCGGTCKKRLMREGYCVTCLRGNRVAFVTEHYKKALNASN